MLSKMFADSGPGLWFDSVQFSYHLESGDYVSVVRDFSLEIRSGSLVAFLGPSGCGKSTLLRLAAGLLTPEQGKIGTGSGSGLPIKECVYLPQRNALFPWLTAVENVRFALRHRVEPANSGLANDYLAEVGLVGLEERYPSQLSGGQQQRVSLARTFASGRAVLLLDEPFSLLDQETRWRMQDLLVALWTRHNQTVIVVTHDVEEAIYLGDSLVVLGGLPLNAIWWDLVPFIRPRRRELRTSSEFVSYRRHVERYLSNDGELP